jgi:PAS domain S-box-containing protein
MTERDIFLKALDMEDPAARADYLATACASDPQLRQRIERLLRLHQVKDTFLDLSVSNSWQPGDSAGRRGDTRLSSDARTRATRVRRTKLTLRESKESNRLLAQKLQLLLDCSDQGVCGIDPSGCCTFINSAAARMLGRLPEQFIGQDIHELLHSEAADGARHLPEECPIGRAIRAGESIRRDDEVFWRLDGSSFPVEYSSFPTADEAGVHGAVLTFSDITERKATEEALRQSEQRFRLIVESMPNAIILVNAEGAIVQVNSQCEKSFCHHREELVGQPVEVLVPERFRAKHPGYRAGFFASPLARPMGAGHDLYARRQDGSEFPVEIGLTPIPTDAGVLVLCVIVDLTERRRLAESRQELAHAARLALVGELTASIAHEINQPLGAIHNYADAARLLLKSSSPDLDQVQEILGNICKDDLRASEVIRRLRALLSKRDIDRQPLEINELLSDVVLLVRTEVRRRGIRVETKPGDDVPLVLGDKVHLQQVLLNLFLNGMDAMANVPGERRLTVRTGVNGSGSVAIAVSDTGPGILPDRLPRLFDPYFSTKNEGMGLGLSIARSLVEAHGGRIWAENNPGGGATFRFTLPTGREQPKPESCSRPQLSAGACV